ncbi:MAG: formyltetrahydrofolate deformylase [Myxococcota bacterium]
MADTFVLTLKCPDRIGIVAAVSSFLAEQGGWITEAHHHSDPRDGVFFMRQEIRADTIPTDLSSFREQFSSIAQCFDMEWAISDLRAPKRVTLLVSKLDHCLSDIFHRWRIGEYNIDITSVISNHADCEELSQMHGVEFHHVPMTKENRPAAFAEIGRLIEAQSPEVIVLARFMQIMPPDLCAKYKDKIINIHHGFLPSFSGAKPYHAAYDAGVKLIGATCHYVTEELDAGPIIEQDVIRVNHADAATKMVTLGRDVERNVLSRGLRYHLEERVIVHNNKTVVFS